jgi:hypothetical protein
MIPIPKFLLATNLYLPHQPVLPLRVRVSPESPVRARPALRREVRKYTEVREHGEAIGGKDDAGGSCCWVEPLCGRSG